MPRRSRDGDSKPTERVTDIRRGGVSVSLRLHDDGGIHAEVRTGRTNARTPIIQSDDRSILVAEILNILGFAPRVIETRYSIEADLRLGVDDDEE